MNQNIAKRLAMEIEAQDKTDCMREEKSPILHLPQFELYWLRETKSAKKGNK